MPKRSNGSKLQNLNTGTHSKKQEDRIAQGHGSTKDYKKMQETQSMWKRYWGDNVGRPVSLATKRG